VNQEMLVFVPLVVTIVMRSRPKGLHIGPRFAGSVRWRSTSSIWWWLYCVCPYANEFKGS